MPKRLLRDGILESRAVNSLTEPAEILYRRLMSVVDDYGRFEADPDIIRARCFPLQLERWPSDRVSLYFTELHRESPLITVFHRGIKSYLQIENFGQRLQAKSKYPAPTDSGCVVDISHPTNEGFVDSKELPCSTVNHGDSPPRASRARTESESESESESETKATTPPTPSFAEYPKTAAAIRRRCPACEDPFILRLVQISIQAAVSVGNGSTPDVTDACLEKAVTQAFADNPKARSGLLLTMVPQILKTWVNQAGSPLHPAPLVDPSKIVHYDPYQFLKERSAK